MESKHAFTGNKAVDTAIVFSSAAIALLYLYTAYFGFLPTFQQRGILLTFCYIIALLKFPMLQGRKRRPLWTIGIDLLLAAVTVLCVYRLIQIEQRSDIGYFHIPTTYDLVLGTGIVISTLEITRRAVGMSLAGLGIGALLYAVFGHNMPGLFRHMPIEFTMLIRYLSFSMDGVFGLPLGVCVTIVVIFILFASLLTQLGLLQFFMDLAGGLTGRYRGGPAKIAVLSSAFMATMSGSGVANVAATGSFTIPLMKNIGYRPDFAGAVEATASTGGGITPPIMGAAAFIIAEYLGISYWEVAVATFLPAFLYFVSVYMGVDLEAMKLGLKGLPREQLPSVRRTLLHGGYMLAPVFVLIYFLGVVRASAMLAGFWAIVSLLVIGTLTKASRSRLLGMGLVDGLANGIKDCIMLTATPACAGIVIGVLMVTGLSTRLGSLLVAISGGNLVVLLALAALLCIILGMGMTTVAVYLLVAIVVAPALIKLGVPPLAAHLFVFFFGNLSHITPPVCVAVFVACGISGGRIFPTAWQAMKLGLILFIYPFFFAFQPSLILQGNAFSIATSLVAATVAVIGLCFAVNNHWWWGRLSFLSRVLFGVGSLALIYPAIPSLATGIALLSAAVAYQLYLKRTEAEALLGGKAGG